MGISVAENYVEKQQKMMHICFGYISLQTI